MVHELDWWDKWEYRARELEFTAAEDMHEKIMLQFTCVPTQHNSGRGALDQGTTLWCGWVVEQLLISKDEAEVPTIRRRGAVYHAGDTGYRRTPRSTAICPVFTEIGEKFGPFDLSFIPIWRGGSLGFVSNLGFRLSHHEIPSALHATPADAIDIHKDILSRNTVAIHFGTFVGSKNESLETIIEFEEARQNRDVLRLDDLSADERDRAGIIDIGGSIAVEIDFHSANSQT